jgi:hypothetical protein
MQTPGALFMRSILHKQKPNFYVFLFFVLNIDKGPDRLTLRGGQRHTLDRVARRVPTLGLLERQATSTGTKK